MSPPRLKPTPDDLTLWPVLLARDPSSPSGLCWRERPLSAFKSEHDWDAWTRKWAWKPAGTCRDGIWRVMIGERKFIAEVIVAELESMGDDTLRPDAAALADASGGTLADIIEDARRDTGSILALLGERSIEGKLSNPRMALRKVKGAEQGVEFPFEPREVVVGETDGGRPIKTFVIDWRADPHSAPAKRAWPKSLVIFKRALDKTLGDRGRRLRPFLDGPEVLAVPAAAVRAEFLKAYPAESDDPKAKAKTKAKAFERAIKQAVEENLVCARELEAESFDTFYWRLDVK